MRGLAVWPMATEQPKESMSQRDPLEPYEQRSDLDLGTDGCRTLGRAPCKRIPSAMMASVAVTVPRCPLPGEEGLDTPHHYDQRREDLQISGHPLY